jgi:putative alpha-1,2-mannosidase
MAKAGPDTLSPAENAAGFVSDENPILGFSQMHDSGTGGNPSLGNFPIFVHPGCEEDDFTKCKFSYLERVTNRTEGSAYGSPGYFRINLTNSVQAEMTTTAHTAMYRFTFPGSDFVTVNDLNIPYSPLILFDLSDLATSRSDGGIQVYPELARVIGEGRYSPSFGMGKYEAYFCADIEGAQVRNTGTFLGMTAAEEPKWLDSVGSGFTIPTGSAGAWLHLTRPVDDSILVRVGLSFISVDQACENAEKEVPDFDFDRVLSDAQTVWGEKLSVIQVDATDVDEEMQTTFWSGLYRTLISPQNYTGENQLWDSSEPYYDS